VVAPSTGSVGTGSSFGAIPGTSYLATFHSVPLGQNQRVSYVDAHARLRGSFPLVRVPRRRTKNFVATIFGERLCAS